MRTKPDLSHACRAAAAACMFLTLAPALLAEPLPDPTRPPEALRSAPAPTTAPAVRPLRLQSVLIGQGRRPAAVISGELVLLGGRVGRQQLVKLTERSAVMHGPDGDTLLALTPAATKHEGDAPSDDERAIARATQRTLPETSQ